MVSVAAEEMQCIELYSGIILGNNFKDNSVEKRIAIKNNREIKNIFYGSLVKVSLLFCNTSCQCS